jgi:hypothetical protein
MHQDFKDWEMIWKTITLLRSLRNLKVELVPPKMDAFRAITREQLSEAEDGLLRSVLSTYGGKEEKMGKGKERKNWELVLPFDRCVGGTVADQLETAGWRITRI